MASLGLNLLFLLIPIALAIAVGALIAVFDLRRSSRRTAPAAPRVVEAPQPLRKAA